MGRRRKLVYLCISAVLILSSLLCNLPTNEPTQDGDYVATLAAMQFTQTAMALAPTETQQPTPTFTSTPIEPSITPPQTGSVSGNLSYPSEWIPAQRVIAFEIGTNNYYYIETSEDQRGYQISGLPAGTYHLIAYLLDGDLKAGYTQAVLCGLTVDCTDHSLVSVQVIPGQNTGDIDIGDWYAPEGSFPSDPLAPQPPAIAPPTTIGGISGKLSYPSEGIPPLQIVAFHRDTDAFYSIETPANQTTYLMQDIPSGIYHVLAYVKGEDYAGGYTEAVVCGLTADCDDHTLIPVSVDPGGETTGVDLVDWYAPVDAFPPNPLK
jgi:hypothetical protein